MKNKSILKPLILCASIALPTFFSVTSCTVQINTYQPINDDHFKYISQHEMSIGAFDVDSTGKVYGYSFGTAWFYKRYANNDYTYEIITNYHVFAGIQGVLSVPLIHVLGFASNEYDPYGYKKIDFQNYSFNEVTLENSFSTITEAYIQFQDLGQYKTYMDICAIKVDLSEAYESASDDPETMAFKKQIDFINANYNKGDKIVKVNEDPMSPGDRVYTAGFPWSTSSPTCEQDYTYFCEEIDYLETLENKARNFVSEEYITYQNQWMAKEKWLTYMGGGASGSMLINENYEVVGIYWGGSGYKDSSEFKKSFALFSIPATTQFKDFFEAADSKLG